MVDVNIENQLVSRTAIVLNYIGENPHQTLTEISTATSTDFNFVSKIVQRSFEAGLVIIEKESKYKKCSLTEMGLTISKSIDDIKKVFEENGSDN